GVAYLPRVGDANFDGAVNFQDLVALAQNYAGHAKDVTQGDFDYNGDVDFRDLVLIAQRYGAAAAPAESGAAAAAASLGVDGLTSQSPLKQVLAPPVPVFSSR